VKLIFGNDYSSSYLLVHASIFYQWNDPQLVLLLFTHHGIGFTGTGLAICKNTDIVALKGMK